MVIILNNLRTIVHAVHGRSLAFTGGLIKFGFCFQHLADIVHGIVNGAVHAFTLFTVGQLAGAYPRACLRYLLTRASRTVRDAKALPLRADTGRMAVDHTWA